MKVGEMIKISEILNNSCSTLTEKSLKEDGGWSDWEISEKNLNILDFGLGAPVSDWEIVFNKGKPKELYRNNSYNKGLTPKDILDCLENEEVISFNCYHEKDERKKEYRHILRLNIDSRKCWDIYKNTLYPLMVKRVKEAKNV